MGQAKLRGTYEQRTTQAKALADVKRAERERHEAAVAAETAEEEARYLAVMSPAQRERYKTRKHNSNMALAILLGTAMGLGRTRHNNRE